MQSCRKYRTKSSAGLPVGNKGERNRAGVVCRKPSSNCGHLRPGMDTHSVYRSARSFRGKENGKSRLDPVRTRVHREPTLPQETREGWGNLHSQSLWQLHPTVSERRGGDFRSSDKCFRRSSTSLLVGLWPSAGPTSATDHRGAASTDGVRPPTKMTSFSLTRSVLVGFDEEYSKMTMMRSDLSTSSTSLKCPHLMMALLNVCSVLLAGFDTRSSPTTMTVLAANRTWGGSGSLSLSDCAEDEMKSGFESGPDGRPATAI